jgi:transcriptional/translational regulatory protein YebC/TACO1
VTIEHGGSLGEPGSVAWQFSKRGVILVDGERYGEEDLMPAIDAGAEDVSEDGDLIKVLTAASDLTMVREALDSAGVEITSAELSMEPKSVVEVEERDAPALLRLMDSLEEHDDVDSVHANFDVAAEILERVAAAS